MIGALGLLAQGVRRVEQQRTSAMGGRGRRDGGTWVVSLAASRAQRNPAKICRRIG